MPRGSQPGERRGGRQKGTPNKLSRDVREMILGALEDAGGQEYLVRQARENPTAFMGLLKGIVPKEVGADVKADIEIREKRQIIDATVEMLLQPGAVRRNEHGTPIPNLSQIPANEARLNRPDNAGPPE